MGFDGNTRYVVQDGADFYIYRDAERTSLQTVWTYKGRVPDFDLPAAERARSACQDQLDLAGYIAIWPNPFERESEA
jgi:hypothetical protein